jgi:hypothetical protein
MNSNDVTEPIILDAINTMACDAAFASCHDTINILQGENKSVLASMASNERLNIATTDSLHKQSLANHESIERNGRDEKDATHRNAVANNLAIERTSQEHISASNTNFNLLSSIDEKSTGDILTNAENIASETRNVLTTNNTGAAIEGKVQLIQLSNNKNTLELIAEQHKNKTELEIFYAENQLKLQASKNTAIIALNALKEKVQLEAEVEECCCELKHEVEEKNHETQKMAKKLDIERLRAELASSTTENLLNRLIPAPVVPVVPVA